MDSMDKYTEILIFGSAVILILLYIINALTGRKMMPTEVETGYTFSKKELFWFIVVTVALILIDRWLKAI